MASLLLGFAACQKDEAASTKQQNISEADLQTAQKITSFIEKMENPMLLKDGSSGETMDLEDARWNLEAALNYQFADVPKYFEEVTVDTLKFALFISGAQVSAEAIAALYQELYTSVENACNTDEGNLLAVSISIENQTESEASILVEVVEANAVYPGSHLPYFADFDYWYATSRKGFCSGPYQGQCKGRDAMTEILRKFNYSIPSIGSSYGATYFTDISYKYFFGRDLLNPDWESGDDPLMRHLLFDDECLDFNDPPCLAPIHLNFYLNNLKDLANNSSYILDGKELISCTDIHFEYAIVIEGMKTTYTGAYYCIVKYGIRHVKPIEI